MTIMPWRSCVKKSISQRFSHMKLQVMSEIDKRPLKLRKKSEAFFWLLSNSVWCVTRIAEKKFPLFRHLQSHYKIFKHGCCHPKWEGNIWSKKSSPFLLFLSILNFLAKKQLFLTDIFPLGESFISSQPTICYHSKIIERNVVSIEFFFCFP